MVQIERRAPNELMNRRMSLSKSRWYSTRKNSFFKVIVLELMYSLNVNDIDLNLT